MSDDDEKSVKKKSGKNGDERLFLAVCGVIGLLTIVFIVLKFCGVLNWSWIWVFSPLWLSVVLFFVFVLAMFVIGAAKR